MTTINSPWTVCPGAPGFSPVAQNWSENPKHSELHQETITETTTALSMQIKQEITAVLPSLAWREAPPHQLYPALQPVINCMACCGDRSKHL